HRECRLGDGASARARPARARGGMKAAWRIEAPLLDLSFFKHRSFTMGLVTGALAMFCIMSLLLYFHLYAQARNGRTLTPLHAGISLVPLSVALLTLALSSSAVAKQLGSRNAIGLGMALIAIACGILGFAARSIVLLAAGFLVMGAGLALPYALAP